MSHGSTHTLMPQQAAFLFFKNTPEGFRHAVFPKLARSTHIGFHVGLGQGSPTLNKQGLQPALLQVKACCVVPPFLLQSCFIALQPGIRP